MNGSASVGEAELSVYRRRVTSECWMNMRQKCPTGKTDWNAFYLWNPLHGFLQYTRKCVVYSGVDIKWFAKGDRQPGCFFPSRVPAKQFQLTDFPNMEWYTCIIEEEKKRRFYQHFLRDAHVYFWTYFWNAYDQHKFVRKWANFLAVAAGHRTKTCRNDTKQWHRDEHFTQMVLDLEWPCNYRPNQSGTSRISGINGQFDRQLTEVAVYGGRKEMPYGICMQYKTVCHDFVQIFIRSMPQRITTCIQNINWGKRVYWMFCQLLPKVCICRLTFFSLYSVLFFFVCGAETTGCNMHWCRFTRLLHR